MFGTFQSKKAQKDNKFQEKFQQKIQVDSKAKQPIQKKPKKKLNNLDQQLLGNKFRMINEFFYTQESNKSKEFFQMNKQDFELYHQGFEKQTRQWPEQPVQLLIKYLENISEKNLKVADLGCGEGKIQDYFLKQKNYDQKFSKFYSIDLVAVKDFIIEKDIKNTGIDCNALDYCFFCLALMGTNYIQFLIEAFRILKVGGKLVISEVNSRITNDKQFVRMIELIGFEKIKYQQPNDYFCIIILKKIGEKNIVPKQLIKDDNFLFQMKKNYKLEKVNFLQASQLLLKPCLYKKR